MPESLQLLEHLGGISMFLLFAAAIIGLSTILIDGNFWPIRKMRDILKKILHREIYAVFECYQCMGTWMGFLCGYLLLTSNPWLIIFVCGPAGSCLASLGVAFSTYLEAQTIINLGDEEDEE